MSGSLTPPAPGGAPPSSPGGMPQPGAGTQPGQPPFGSSPVSAPTPNRGLQAAGLAQVVWAIRLLEKALPSIGAATPPGKDILKAISSLTKHVPAGAASPGMEQTALQGLMQQSKQEAPQLQAMRAATAQGGPMTPGAPGAPGAPSPSAPGAPQ